MPEWKKELHKLYPQPKEPSGFWNLGMNKMEAFIESQLEKLIDEIPDIDWGDQNGKVADLKAQLRKEWGLTSR